METEQTQTSAKPRLLLKVAIIAIIILTLQIPTLYVSNLVEERETRQAEAITEVSSKWAGIQNINGPVIVIPYWENVNGSGQILRKKDFAYFLPDVLNYDATAVPQERYRGIYKVILYTASVKINGNFSDVDPQKLNIDPADLAWNDAFVLLNISDLKGLNDEVKLSFNNQTLTLVPSSNNFIDGLTAPLHVSSIEDLKNISFSTTINIGGSQQLLFTPSGKITNAKLTSGWPHPSFAGDVLPQSKTINNSGFTAQWRSLAYKRKFPQQWKGRAYNTVDPENNIASSVASNSFGADFYVPVNAYQKTTRSVKYSFLCIVLTFAFFFIVESTNKKSVHPFQYGLIGIALVLFYTLLLSFSEYTGFNVAYLIASICTISLIGWFIKGVLESSRLAILLSCILLLTYSYIFTILQLQDFALLLGSVGLFITLGVIMYFSRKIQW